MRRFQMPWQLCAAAIGGLLAAGCGSSALQIPTLATFDGYDKDIDSLRPFTTLNQPHYAQPLPIDLMCFAALAGPQVAQVSFKDNTSDPAIDIRQKKLAKCGLEAGLLTVPPGENYRHVIRNAVQNELMRRSDQMCSYYLTRMMYGRFVGGAGANAVKSIAKAIKAVYGTIDTFADAFVTDASNISNPEILEWKAFSDTTTKIAKARRTLRGKIRISQYLDANQYGLDQAIYDTQRYHDVCNFVTAFATPTDFDLAGDEIVVPDDAAVHAYADGTKKASALIVPGLAATSKISAPAAAPAAPDVQQ